MAVKTMKMKVKMQATHTAKPVKMQATMVKMQATMVKMQATMVKMQATIKEQQKILKMKHHETLEELERVTCCQGVALDHLCGFHNGYHKMKEIYVSSTLPRGYPGQDEEGPGGC